MGVKVENFIEGIFDKGFSLTEHFLSPIASFSGNRWHMEDREEKEAKPRILDYMRDLLYVTLQKKATDRELTMVYCNYQLRYGTVQE